MNARQRRARRRRLGISLKTELRIREVNRVQRILRYQERQGLLDDYYRLLERRHARRQRALLSGLSQIPA